MRLRQAAKPLEPSREQLISVANEAARPVDPPLVALLRNFFENRPAEVESLLRRYDRKSQELIMSMLPLWDIVNKGGIEKASPKEVAMVVAETERISAALAPHAKLEIDKLCFCSVVQDFGFYTPLEDDHPFRQGEKMHVYAEVRNFLSERRGSIYGIHVSGSIEIHGPDGSHVMTITIPRDSEPDLRQSPRHDFKKDYQIRLGDKTTKLLVPGIYKLSLHLVDVPTGRKVTRTLDFRVVASSNQ